MPSKVNRIKKTIVSGFLNNSLQVVGPVPIVCKKDPVNGVDFAEVGTIWSNRLTGTLFMNPIEDLWTTLSQGGAGLFTSIVVDPGDITVTDGDVDILLGDLNVDDGDILVDAGDITATDGDIIATNGDIVATDGDIEATNGNLIVGGLAGTNIINGTTTINASNNANTGINTGTSTGSVTIGNTGAGGAIAINSSAAIDISPGATSSIIVSGAGQDLVLESGGGSVNIFGNEAVADAVTIFATAGGVIVEGAIAAADAVTITASDLAGGVKIIAGATPGITYTNGTQTAQILVGTGSPNGAVAAAQGSLFINVAGNSSTTVLYCNTDGADTWAAVGA